MKDKKPIIEVKKLWVSYIRNKKVYSIINKASFTIFEGETLGLVGESGSGKTTIGRAIIGLIPYQKGLIKVDDIIIPSNKSHLSSRTRKEIASKVQMIFQNPKTSLNPTKKIKDIIAEGFLNFNYIKDEYIEEYTKCNKKMESIMKEFEMEKNPFDSKLSLLLEEKEKKLKKIQKKYQPLIEKYDVSYREEEKLKNLINQKKYLRREIAYEKKIYQDNYLFLKKRAKLQIHNVEQETKSLLMLIKDAKKDETKEIESLEQKIDEKEYTTYIDTVEINLVFEIKKLQESLLKLAATAPRTGLLWETQINLTKSKLSLTDKLNSLAIIVRCLYNLKIITNFEKRKFLNQIYNLNIKSYDDPFSKNTRLELFIKEILEYIMIKHKKINYEIKNIEKAMITLRESIQGVDFERKQRIITKLKTFDYEKRLKEEYLQILDHFKEKIKSEKELHNKKNRKAIYKMIKSYISFFKMINLSLIEEELEGKIQNIKIKLGLTLEQIKSSIKAIDHLKKDTLDNLQQLESMPSEKLAKWKLKLQGEMDNVQKKYMQKKEKVIKNETKYKFNQKKLDLLQKQLTEVEKEYKRIARKYSKVNMKRLMEAEIVKYLEMVGMDKEHLNRYPSQFSGGQQQRIGIARALITKPKILIADEPISALDISIQSQILNLLNEIKRKRNISMIFIAHDLRSVQFISDRIAVIIHGNIVEIGPANEIMQNPIHPYTKSLISTIPSINELRKKFEKSNYKWEDHHYDSFNKPKVHYINSSHQVLATKEEFEEWTKKKKIGQSSEAAKYN